MSLTKTESNRINSKNSTGPTTPAGKAAVKFNALKLDIYTKEAVLPTEDSTQYRELLAAFPSEYSPETPTETYLIDNIVISIWHRCVQAAEAGLQALHRREQSERIKENVEMANATRVDPTSARMLSGLWRRATAAVNQTPTECTHKHFLSKSPIAFGGELS